MMVISKRSSIVTCALLACIVIMIAFAASSNNVYGAKGNDVFDELSDFISLSDALKGSGGSSGGSRGGSSSGSSRSSSSSSSSRSSSSRSSSTSSRSSSRSSSKSSRSSSKATSSKTASTTSKKNTAPANKVAAAYKQYAQSRIAGMKSVPNSKLAAAHKQYAQSRIAGMKASPKTTRSALTGRFNAAFSKQTAVNNGKLNANAIRASYQKQQTAKVAAAYKQYAQSRIAGMKSVPTSKLAAAHKQYAQSRIAGMKSVPTSKLAAAHKQYAQSRLSATAKGYQIDKGLLGKLEGFKTTGYVPQDKKGNVIGKSGVTIGTGFDLGQQSKASLEKLGLSKAMVDKLSPYTGKKQQVAKDFLAKNPLSLTEAQTQAIDKAVVDKYAASLAKDYESIAAKNPKSIQKFSDLPAAVQTVAYSVHHQYGSLSRTPNFQSKLAKNDFQGMVNELKNFGDAYSTRRNAEAEHLSNSLSEIRG